MLWVGLITEETAALVNKAVAEAAVEVVEAVEEAVEEVVEEVNKATKQKNPSILIPQLNNYVLEKMFNHNIKIQIHI